MKFILKTVLEYSLPRGDYKNDFLFSAYPHILPFLVSTEPQFSALTSKFGIQESEILSHELGSRFSASRLWLHSMGLQSRPRCLFWV
jgi:hypothetical protein